MIGKEKEILEYLNIPSIPKKKWDGEKSFKDGVAVTKTISGKEFYAVATFDKNVDKEPRIKHVFSVEPFRRVGDIFVVPSYMDEEVEKFDMDEDSKKAAQQIIDEARELEMRDVEKKEEEINKNEYFFENINTDEEGMAFIKAYNQKNKIKGKVPTTHDGIVMRLAVIYSDLKDKK